MQDDTPPHTHTRTNAHTHIYMCVHNCTHACTRTCVHAARGHTHAHAHKHPRTCVHTRARPHRYMHIRHTPARTHTCGAAGTHLCVFTGARFCACHASTRVHGDTQTHARMHSRVPPAPRTQTQTPAHPCAQTHTCTHLCVFMHAHACTRTQTHAHASRSCIHTRAHTHAHSHADPAAAPPSPVPLSPRSPRPPNSTCPAAAARWGHRQLRHAGHRIAAGLSSTAGHGDAPPVTAPPTLGGLRTEPCGQERLPSQRAKPWVHPPALNPGLVAAGGASSPARSGCSGTALAARHPSAKAGCASGCPLNSHPDK